MPTWTNAPPADQRQQSMPLVRTPAGKPLTAIVTCQDLIGCSTHYWGGHTVPCEDAECEPCAKGIPSRWHGYLSCLNAETRQHFLFEVTAHASIAFLSYRDTYASLRGCMFQARRATYSANSRVTITTKPADLEKWVLPTEPDILRILATIWSLPLAQLTPPRRPDQPAEITQPHETLQVMRGIILPGAKPNGSRPL